MQLHQLKPTHRKSKIKRVGRGGKRGTFSGRGSKGQKARAGHRIRPGFRGGNEPLWKVFPKQRGATKKVEIRHAKFQLRRVKPVAINLDRLARYFKTGDVVNLTSLQQNGIVDSKTKRVKILSDGDIAMALTVEGVTVSAKAREKILGAKGTVK